MEAKRYQVIDLCVGILAVHDTHCVFNGLKEAVVTLHEALQKKPRDYGTQGIYNILGNYMLSFISIFYKMNDFVSF